ncbi:hypothetical protein [Paraburkholderia ginsengisoli]|uniref:Replication initiation protein n=1 Tax=Paraburkholderia ginsengisoli TaxID=311231 RepID=A0A7T4T7U7_9BURK|nr:hypothetical protein [Paraburkholderia ginsengisoli]QQC62778.1 hypothetical protein I6I06_10615 [Paraburkholderia ginsengisoli]
MRNETVSFDWRSNQVSPLNGTAQTAINTSNEMDYSHLRFRAEVDWIEVEISTVTRTNFQTVKRALKATLSMLDDRKTFVEAQDEGPGGAASVFRFRLHDPEAWSFVASTLEQLERKFHFANPAKVTAIEVAFDAYSRTESAVELAEQAMRYYKFCTLVVANNDNCRIYRDFRGSGASIPFHRGALVRRLSAGWQIAIGNKTDDRYQHIYVKTTDENGTALPQADHRARIEITLRGDALPYRHVAEWADADFANDLSMSAKFRMMRPNLSLLQKLMLEDTTIQVGERKQRWRVAKDRSGYSGERQYRTSTKADNILNGKARDAFRDLSRRWRQRAVRPVS